MKRFLTFPFVVLTLALAACYAATSEPSGKSGGTETTSEDAGTSATEPEPQPEPDPNAWQDTAMQNLVATRCAISGCHNGTQAPNFAGITETAMRANRQVAREVSSGAMPRNSRLTTAEKQIVATFYAN